MWPFAPEALTVVDGAMDALDRVAQVVVRLGDRVVVEHPTFPPLLDLLEQLGAEVIGVDVDDAGIGVEGLRRALERASEGRVPPAARPEPDRRRAQRGAGRGARRG